MVVIAGGGRYRRPVVMPKKIWRKVVEGDMRK